MLLDPVLVVLLLLGAILGVSWLSLLSAAVRRRDMALREIEARWGSR